MRLIESLLPMMDDYLQQDNPPDKDMFLQWAANEKLDTAQLKGEEKLNLGVELVTYLRVLYRFAVFTAKKALENSELKSPDEWMFLVQFIDGGELSKSELINFHVVEFSSGTEIINRLIRKDLLEEFPDPNDKRAKKLKLTQKGMDTLKDIIPHMTKAVLIIAGDLPDNDLIGLVSTLKKLEKHHRDCYDTRKKQPLQLIFEDLISQSNEYTA